MCIMSGVQSRLGAYLYRGSAMKNQLTSSQAHKLSGEVVGRFRLAGLLMILFVAGGCQPVVSRSVLTSLSDASHAAGTDAEACSIDAGIILAGQSSYLCWPLTQLGIDEVTAASDIVSLETSCACVRASLVAYYDSPSRVLHALRLDFTPESTTTGEEVRPAHLAVEVTLKLASGALHTLTVKVLETQACSEFSDFNKERP